MAREKTPAAHEVTLAGDYKNFTPDMLGVASVGEPVAGGPVLLSLFKNIALPVTSQDQNFEYSIVYQLNCLASMEISLDMAKDLVEMLQETIDKIEADKRTSAGSEQ